MTCVEQRGLAPRSMIQPASEHRGSGLKHSWLILEFRRVITADLGDGDLPILADGPNAPGHLRSGYPCQIPRRVGAEQRPTPGLAEIDLQHGFRPTAALLRIEQDLADLRGERSTPGGNYPREGFAVIPYPPAIRRG